jgi:hypothetical protein
MHPLLIQIIYSCQLIMGQKPKKKLDFVGYSNIPHSRNINGCHNLKIGNSIARM